MKRVVIVLALLVPFLWPLHDATAGARSALLREAIEAVQRKFGKEVIEEFGETGSAVLARKMENLAAKHGDELVADAAGKVGPRMFRYIEEVGEDGSLKALKLMSRHGDEAVWVVSKPGRFTMFMRYGDDAADAMIKHKQISEALIERFGSSGARAMAAVDGPAARRIAMMADGGDLGRMAQPAAILDVIGKYGDRAADWVWRNKGALVVVSVAAAFVANPELFLSGAVEVVRVGSEHILRPVAERAAESINWNLWVPVALVVCFGMIGLRFGWRWLLPKRQHVAKSQPECAP
jgi:hypothetical protein